MLGEMWKMCVTCVIFVGKVCYPMYGMMTQNDTKKLKNEDLMTVLVCDAGQKVWCVEGGKVEAQAHVANVVQNGPDGNECVEALTKMCWKGKEGRLQLDQVKS